MGQVVTARGGGGSMKILILGSLLIAAPVCAEDKLRDLCAERPGLDTPACIVDAGHLQVEVGLGDWTLDRQAGSRSDMIVTGDLSARYGVGDSTEIRFGWTAYGHARTRDTATGAIDRALGTGDVTLGLKQNLFHPDGGDFSLALLPYATLPTGKKGIGAGDWGAGLLIPLGFDLTEKLTLVATPEIDAAIDEDGKGRHAAYGSAAGLGVKLGEKWSMSIEGQLICDRDPDGHSTQALAGAYIAWQPSERIQFDAGAQAGLNRATPDVELYFGISEKF
ncbi:MAG TPA: transporter [Sphingomonas sp.]|nr:transporter [Sphingomonas sp.]